MGITINLDALKNPKPSNQKDLLNYLIKPDNTGDLHLKRLIKMSGYYAIRKILVEDFVKSFYNVMWDKNNKLRTKLLLVNI